MTDRSIVRDEDAFDIARMHAWLREHITDLPNVDPDVEQFTKGASNLTYRLTYPDRSFVLRRPPAGMKAASAHDMGREVHVLERLAEPYPYVPAVRAYCTDETVIGTTFYVMDYLDGTILRPDNAELLTEQSAALVGDLYVDRWADLHTVDIQAASLADWGKGPGYVERQITGWSERYRRARTDDVPDGEDVMTWLHSHMPDDVAACVIHGDWRLDNMVLNTDSLTDGERPEILGVLDWEMSTIGDPLMDVGAALAYWIDSTDAAIDPAFAALKRQPSDIPGMPTRSHIKQRYAERMGFTDVNWNFYETYGLFRLAVILQQIWARFRAGQTTNPAFSEFGAAVQVLLARAARSR